MRVFSVEMLVKEEGAAVVEAALKKLKAEAASVGAQLKTTSQAVTGTGAAIRSAGQAAEISGTSTAKAAIKFAAVGQSLATAGGLTKQSALGMIQAGSQIAMMFGPKGIAVGALIGFGAAAVSEMSRTRRELEETRKKFEDELNRMVNAGDKLEATQAIRDIEFGVPAGALDTIIDANDGLRVMRQRVQDLTDSGFITWNKANREESKRLTASITEQERKLRQLRDVVMAPMPTLVGTAAPVTITGVKKDDKKDPLLDRITIVLAYNKALEVNQRELADVRAIEADLVSELAKTNVPMERRVKLQQALNDARELLNDKTELEAQRERIRLEVELQKLLPESLARTEELARLKTVLNAELMQENLALARQVEIRKLLADIAKIEEPAEKEKSKRNASQQSFGEYYATLLEDMKTLDKTMGELLYDDVFTTIAGALEQGFSDGIVAAINSGRISDLWKVMGQTMLAQLANMMVNVALSYIGYAKMIASIQKFLIANPVAAVAVAATMLAFAYNNGGKATSGNSVVGGSAGGLVTGMTAGSSSTQQLIFGQTSATTAAGMQPRQATNVTIIGPNDPSAQRAMQELLNKANSRGSLG